MKKVLFILIILFGNNLVSQNKKIIYVDENYKKVGFLKFKKKESSMLFDLIIAENDTVIIKKLRYKEFFGKLDHITKKQLSLIFNSKYNIDTTKTWLIHNVDSVPDIKRMPKKSGIEFLDSLQNPTGIFWTKKELKTNSKEMPYKRHRHVSNFEDYLNKINVEKKSIKKNIELLHFYSKNNGFPIKTLNEYDYFEDYNSLIRKLFTDGTKAYKVIILFTDGSFYASNVYNCIKLENKLTTKKYFNRKKKKWYKKINKLNKD
ncbi:hypothetical protein [uncultured Polaribacter sp.]|uniref:hypothetical protein n=1 Tax=uncultured Polaribacter sp. TaxID=174711 RepID=UPI002619408F|nr:hypothetical protein [uncultured Polaribacter sp.]